MADKNKKMVLVKRPTSVGAKPQYRPMSTDINELVREKKQKKIGKKIVSTLFVGGLIFTSAYCYLALDESNAKLRDTQDLLTAETKKTSELDATLTKLTAPPKWKQFTAPDFQMLVTKAAFEGTAPSATPGIITGDGVIDAYIVSKATERGYELRPLAAQSNLFSIDGFMLQADAAKAWLELRIAAAKEGVSIRLTSAFRSIDDQQLIFLERSGIYGLDSEYILSGLADEAIIATLQYVSPPGYSRHHTGYAIDIEDVKRPTLDEFVNSEGYAWISKNNYENAKKHGFIPSYPSGADKQGPEPEPWEYLFVGASTLKE